ncbi:hypothetical protein AYO49_02045 [Verrucomicrobiaceae bacterium SCGC AG-212-N21]|nr:hypothetical protein AYO49_02045 [Verrucomicrobiaceae bacterium SCGC AG-212-N21]
MTGLSSHLREPQSALRLSRTFLQGLTAVDLVDPLLSLDENQPVAMAQDLFHQKSVTVLGVRRAGAIVGWVQADDLTEGCVGDHVRPFDSHEILDEKVGLDVVLTKLADKDHLFISWLGDVTGVITKRDLQEAPMRMWLFGAITLLDLNTTWAIDQLYPDEGWKSLISEGRLEKAQALCSERQKRGSPCRLVDCLQVKDKADIILRDRAHLAALHLASRREADRFARDIESLRNHLAHAQELEAEHLATAARLATFIQSIVHAEGVREIISSQHSSSPSTETHPDTAAP